LRRLPAASLPTATVGFVSIPLALPPLHRTVLELSLAYALIWIVLAWWLPRGQGAALWSLIAVAGLAVPLLAGDPLMAACGLLVAVAALAPVLAQGEEDGGAALFIGLAALGAVMVVLGLAAAHAPATLEVVVRTPLARAAIMAGFALLLGVLPPLFWLPGVSRLGHPLGVALVVGPFSAVAMLVLLSILTGAGAGWLASGSEGQALAPAGILIVLVAALLALVQSDVRRLFGFLCLADLGYTMMTLGSGLARTGIVPDETVLTQMLGRSLACLLIVPTLAFLTSGCRRNLRPALVALLAYGGWALFGGPLTPSFAVRWAALQPLLSGDQPWSRLLAAGIGLSWLAYLALLVRAARLPVLESDRPAPRVALLLLALVMLVCLFLSSNSGWLLQYVQGVVAR
jgi:formate hydrogenlyase subunit 3/multisubunit Na+/H+ antiporter MnhD subunit